MGEKIVFVTLTDEKYFNKCKKTILDLKSIGKWMGDVVIISVNFNIPNNFKNSSISYFSSPNSINSISSFTFFKDF